MKKSKFQERLNEITKKLLPVINLKTRRSKIKLHTEDLNTQGTDDPTTLTAHTFKDRVSTMTPKRFEDWKKADEELPPYYVPIHIFDGKMIYHNFSRVWSETVGNVYVNNHSNKVICKITHWIPPFGVKYPKYDPMTIDDITTDENT